jgi:3-methyladenine DNA glycosylase AlkD
MKIIHKIVSVFEKNQNPACAEWHYAYMRRQFPFLGIQKPLRKKLQTPFVKELFSLHQNGDPIISALWTMPHREYQYLAMDVLSSPTLVEADFPLLEWLIQEKSWWDTVDLLASNHVGKLCKKSPSLIPKVDAWLTNQNLWLRRSALLYQLRYKQDTDEECLFSSCLKLSGEKEFFIQKAIAWALREYAKTSPKSVNALLKKAHFRNLVLREINR